MTLLCAASLLLRSAVNPMVFAKCRFALGGFESFQFAKLYVRGPFDRYAANFKRGGSVDFFRFSVGGK